MEQQGQVLHPARRRIAQGLSLIEDAVYVGLGVLLAVSALSLLGTGFGMLGGGLVAGTFAGKFIELLDRILLILLVIELLYTVRVSFHEHGLLAEPFLVVALIAVIRRILVITAEIAHLPQAGDPIFRLAIIELGVLTLMIVVLVASLIALQREARRSSGAGPHTGPVKL
jgi:uncharacterized membrane protein (DUF373 family)